jgi:uncharacterized protein (DUF1501 family)
MAYSRSEFLKGALRFGAIGTLTPSLIMDGRLAERVLAAGARDSADRILVVIQLAGGNDGLNTLIPYADGLYYQNRPTLAIPQSQVLHLNSQVGFHPNLTALKQLYDQGNVAVVQGVGYPDPNLSHFRSTDIWQSAQPVGVTETGWIGRYLDSALAHIDNPLKAISIGPLLSKAFWAKQTMVPAVQNLHAFRLLSVERRMGEAQRVISTFQQIYGADTTTEGPYLSLVQMADSSAYQATVQLAAAASVTTKAQYPATALGKQLQLVSQIIASNLGTRVFAVVQGGYDDHAQETKAHPQLMKDLSDAIAAFYQDLSAAGRAKQVLMMTYSEFGRRPLENASSGTDHGTAAPMLIVGGAVKGGLYGKEPSLSTLNYGNLQFTTDFRSVYSTVLAGWMGADPTPAVLGTFPTIPFV